MKQGSRTLSFHSERVNNLELHTVQFQENLTHFHLLLLIFLHTVKNDILIYPSSESFQKSQHISRLKKQNAVFNFELAENLQILGGHGTHLFHDIAEVRFKSKLSSAVSFHG